MKLLGKLGILVVCLFFFVLQKLRLVGAFKQEPTIWSMGELVKTTREITTEIDGKVMPYRPLGAIGMPARLKAAWAVFTGRADALTWPGGQ